MPTSSERRRAPLKPTAIRQALRRPMLRLTLNMASASRTSAAFRGEAFRSTSVMAFVPLMPDHVAEISRSFRSKV